MKTISTMLSIFLSTLCLAVLGCNLTPSAEQIPETADKNYKKLSISTAYTAAKIDILPLTSFETGMGERNTKINIYVSLSDSFGCQLKSPGIFRFELYEHIQRSAKPKGNRIVIWPDIDLTDAVQNHTYWRDFLRAYEFNLDVEPQSNQTYMLQVTCLCPNNKRLSVNAIIKYLR